MKLGDIRYRVIRPDGTTYKYANGKSEFTMSIALLIVSEVGGDIERCN